MATIRKRGNGWQVQIRKKNHHPVCKTFHIKSEAIAWAKIVEYEQERGIYLDKTIAETTTVIEILERFEVTVTVKSKRAGNERSCMKHLYKYFGNFTVSSITSVKLAEYRDMRLELVGPQTVKHELGLMNRVLKRAHEEWGIIIPGGVPSVRKPKLPEGRDRRLEGDEEARIINSLLNTPIVQSITQFAIETAMRRGEICNMEWKHINMDNHTLLIPITKTGKARTIPLSQKAMKILYVLPRRADGYVFGIKPDSVTRAFIRACDRENIKDLRFHDLRHEATSRLFEKGLSIMEVASITGHKSLSMLTRYTHLRAEDLVDKIGYFMGPIVMQDREPSECSISQGYRPSASY